MSKQTFKIGKSFIPNILVLSCSAILLFFATLLAVSPVASHTNALVQTGEDGLSLVTNQVVDATIRPEEDGSLSIIKDTIIGSTNSQYGYEIYISVNSDEVNDIYLNGNSSNDGANQKINATTGTYDTPAALDLTNGATWGYAIAGLGNFDASYNIYTPSNSSKFAAMPIIENKQLIHEVTTAATDDETEIYYGIKADSSLEPGLYKTEILYTAVPKQAPRVAKAILGDNGKLSFVYDNLVYTVGDTYANAEILNVYTVPAESTDNSDIPWSSDSAVRNSILSANFESSFHDFKPTSTAYWLSNLSYLSSVTNLENLDTSEATSLAYMFGYSGSNSSVTAIDYGNIKSLDVSNAITLHGMFTCTAEYATTINLDLAGWDLSSASDLGNMFDDFGEYAKQITMDLKNWKVPNVSSIYHMFWNVGYLYGVTTELDTFVHIDVSGWQLGNLRTAESAFWYTGGYADELSIVGLSDWDVSTLVVAKEMFMCTGIDVDNYYLKIEGWDFSSIGTMVDMFYEAGLNATTWRVDASGWKSIGGGHSRLFGLAGKNATTWMLDASGWTFKDGITVNEMFNSTANPALSNGVPAAGSSWTIDVTDWTFGQNNVLYKTFFYSGYTIETWTMIGASTWNMTNVPSCVQTFDESGYYATSWSVGDLSGWDTSATHVMNRMFGTAGYRSGTNFYVGDISGWNTQCSHTDFIVEDPDNPHGVIEPNWQN